MYRRLIHLPIIDSQRTFSAHFCGAPVDGHIAHIAFVWMNYKACAIWRYDSYRGAPSSMPSEMASMTIALYCRVSTDEQAQHGFSIDNQKERLVAYCKSQGWDKHRLYIDDGCTGTNLDRPALQRLLHDVHSGIVNVVVVYKLDRLSRKQRDVLYLLEDEFERHNVSFKSATEPFDTASPLGKAMLGILAVFAQLERDTIVDRLTTGLRQRVKAGKWPGGRVPFGYTYNHTTGKLDIHPLQADLVRELFRRYLRGSSLSDLAGWMASKTNERTFQHGTIRDMLARRLYIGESVFGDVLSSEIAEAIIDSATFDMVQQEMQRRMERKVSAGEYLLTGLLRCALCGSPFIHVIRRNGRGKRKTYRLYACKNQHHRPRGTSFERCQVGYRNQDDLEQWVVHQLFTAVLDEAELRHVQDTERVMSAETSDTLQSLKMEVRKIERRLERWYDAFEDETIDASMLKARTNKLEEQKHLIQNRIGQLELQRPNTEMNGFEEPTALIREAWSLMTWNEQRDVLRAAIDTIIVTPKGQDPHIIWHA
jgi:site-specific DNA recombinase